MRVLFLGVLLGSAILASLLPSASASSGSLTLQVEPQTEECFYEEVENGKTLNMNFEVIRGGLLDIQVRIYNPKSRVVYEKMAYFSRKTGDESENEGKVSVVATFTGVHKICFDNTMSRWTAKVVTFHIGDAPKAHHEDIARLEHLGPVVDSVIKISDDLDTVERLQHHMRVRERVHRDTIENTASRVQWMHVIETLVLIALGFFEVSYIRAWFNDTAKAGRV